MENALREYHQPVLLNETIEALMPKDKGIYIDCTLGDGGHAEAILQASGPNGRLLGIDADPEALSEAEKWLADHYDEDMNVYEEKMKELVLTHY